MQPNPLRKWRQEKPRRHRDPCNECERPGGMQNGVKDIGEC